MEKRGRKEGNVLFLSSGQCMNMYIVGYYDDGSDGDGQKCAVATWVGGAGVVCGEKTDDACTVKYEMGFFCFFFFLRFLARCPRGTVAWVLVPIQWLHRWSLLAAAPDAASPLPPAVACVRREGVDPLLPFSFSLFRLCLSGQRRSSH